MKIVPEEKINPCLHHSTRDEDGETAWCDTCQKVIKGSTLFDAGYNACRQTVLNNLKSKEMVELIKAVLPMYAVEKYSHDSNVSYLVIAEGKFDSTALAIIKALIGKK